MTPRAIAVSDSSGDMRIWAEANAGHLKPTCASQGRAGHLQQGPHSAHRVAPGCACASEAGAGMGSEAAVCQQPR